MTLQDLEQLVAAGESETVEFKKSTAQLTRAGETLCAFLNGQGGRVFMGVTPEGRILGQQVADSTLREVAAMLARFEPPALISQERIGLPNGAEQWGRGTNKIVTLCDKAGLLKPEFGQQAGSVFVRFRASADGISESVTGQVTGQVTARLLAFCSQPKRASEIQSAIGIKHRETFVNNYLNPLLVKGWLERTNPDKPRSRLQQYRLTEKGRMQLRAPDHA